MKLPDTLPVNKQNIDISTITAEQIDYYQKLAVRLQEKYRQGGDGRQIFTLSGPAGAGKSVITAILEYIFSDNSDFLYVNVALDAFHYPNEVLDERKLRSVKGRFDTYDTDLLIGKLKQFKVGEPVTFPTYSRQLHNPIPNSIAIADENFFMLLEGQWLLRNTPDWAKVRELCSYHLEVTGPPNLLRENVINRHVAGGRTKEDAEAFYNTSDLINTKEVQSNSVEPDERLVFYKDILPKSFQFTA